jgi:ABC-type oligopeptide transport system ATPase subunit
MLQVKRVKKNFKIKKHFFDFSPSIIKAVDDISFSINKGESFGVVGESGSGKSTLGKLIIGLLAADSGDVLFNNKRLLHRRKDLLFFRKNIQMIFQDPYSSLNPRKKIYDILLEPFIIHKLNNINLDYEIDKLLLSVGLQVQDKFKFPHEFSGGGRQRIGIARALALRPQLIIADEPVSSLDVSIQAQILNLLQDLKEQEGLSYLFISHDLTVVEHMCDRVAVMQNGKFVEVGSQENIYKNPQHPYTKKLIQAIPKMPFADRNSTDCQFN